MLQSIQVWLFEMSETDCRTIPRSTRLSEGVVMTSFFAALVEKRGAHYSVRTSAFMIAAIRVVLD